MQAASTFSFNINKEMKRELCSFVWAVIYSMGNRIACKTTNPVFGPHLETDHSAKKVERTSIPAPLGNKWLRDLLPGTEMKLVWIWTELICQHYHLCSARSLARRQASAVDILPLSNCLEDMSVFHDLAKGKLCTYHPLSDLSAGHGSLLPIPLSIISVPSALVIFFTLASFFPHSTTLLSPSLRIDHFELREKHTWFLAQALNHIFLCVLYFYLDVQRSSAQTRCIFM